MDDLWEFVGVLCGGFIAVVVGFNFLLSRVKDMLEPVKKDITKLERYNELRELKSGQANLYKKQKDIYEALREFDNEMIRRLFPEKENKE